MRKGAARAARDRASAEFGLARVVALVPPAHDASRRVAEKLGMGAEGATVVDGRDYEVYAG